MMPTPPMGVPSMMPMIGPSPGMMSMGPVLGMRPLTEGHMTMIPESPIRQIRLSACPMMVPTHPGMT